jgi:hypothetical protein
MRKRPPHWPPVLERAVEVLIEQERLSSAARLKTLYGIAAVKRQHNADKKAVPSTGRNTSSTRSLHAI